MSAIKQGKAIYASLPWSQERRKNQIKVVVELDDGSVVTTWINKARALELSGQLKRLAE